MDKTREELIDDYRFANRRAQSACDALSNLLHARYGKRAGDMRYRPAETAEIHAAKLTLHHASAEQHAAWLAYSRQE